MNDVSVCKYLYAYDIDIRIMAASELFGQFCCVIAVSRVELSIFLWFGGTFTLRKCYYPRSGLFPNPKHTSTKDFDVP